MINSPLQDNSHESYPITREEAKKKARRKEYDDELRVYDDRHRKQEYTFFGSVYSLYTQPGDKPLKLGVREDGAIIKSPDWLKDSVMPSRMPNGMAYSEMSSLIRLHLDDAGNFNGYMAESDKPLEYDENLSIWLYKNAAEQDLLMRWFREFLSEVWVNDEMAAEAYSEKEYRENAWLFRALEETDFYYCMSYGQLLKTVDDYFGNVETAVDICFDGDPFPHAVMAMYKCWVQGEELLGVFEGMLDDIISSCCDIIEARKEEDAKKKEGDADGQLSEK